MMYKMRRGFYLVCRIKEKIKLDCRPNRYNYAGLVGLNDWEIK
jgi:hypothetical protein